MTVCIREKLEKWEARKTFDVCYEQLKAFADNMSSRDDVVHVEVCEWLSKNVSVEVASQTRIIYGSSVNGGNYLKLEKQEDIDCFLVGGASLKGLEFAIICNSVTTKKELHGTAGKLSVLR